jgi:hypothetical protein
MIPRLAAALVFVVAIAVVVGLDLMPRIPAPQATPKVDTLTTELGCGA